MAQITSVLELQKQAADGVPISSCAALGIDDLGNVYKIEHDGTITLLVASSVAGKYRIKSDGSLQLWNTTQSKWHSLTVTGGAGAEVLSLAAGE